MSENHLLPAEDTDCLDPLLELLENNRLYPTNNDDQVRQWPDRKNFVSQIRTALKQLIAKPA